MLSLVETPSHRRMDAPLHGAMPIEVAIATNADGAVIRDLGIASGWGQEWSDAIDWSDIEPYWLVARIDGGIAAALQVCAGKPIGRIELLSVDPELSHRRRARVVREITYVALAALKANGCQAVSATVDHDMRYFRRALQRRGASVVASGSTLGMVL